MIKGIDISYCQDGMTYDEFVGIKEAGYDFVIIRVGFGTHTMDDEFIDKVNNAKAAGLRVSVYHFSEALDVETAVEEAKFVKQVLEENGVGCERIWLDMENSNYKSKNDFEYSMENITAISKAFLDELGDYNKGIYANFNWLENYIDWQSLGCPVWAAGYTSEDEFGGALWQYTDSEEIGNRTYDANISYNDLI